MAKVLWFGWKPWCSVQMQGVSLEIRLMLYARISEPASWAVLHTAIKEIRGSKRLHHPGLNPEIHVLKNVAHG